MPPSKIVGKMDVISAMEAVEDASGQHNARKKTPPSGSSQDEKKRLIRELGRKPSEEKVSLYVRKPSLEKPATSTPSQQQQPSTQQQQQQQKDETSRAQKFLDSMARRSTEVPTDFLNTIEEERTKSPEYLNGSTTTNGENTTMGKILAKKYPFNRLLFIQCTKNNFWLQKIQMFIESIPNLQIFFVFILQNNNTKQFEGTPERDPDQES